MAELKLNQEWGLTLTTPELRLVLRGLRGTLKPEEDGPAEELCNKITAARAAVIKNQNSTADRLLRDVGENNG